MKNESDVTQNLPECLMKPCSYLSVLLFVTCAIQSSLSREAHASRAPGAYPSAPASEPARLPGESTEEDTPDPRITSVAPMPFVGSNAMEWISIIGEGFEERFSIRLRTDSVDAHITDPQRLRYVDPAHVQVRARLGSEAATWTVEVLQADSLRSNIYAFTLEAPVPVFSTHMPDTVTAGTGALWLELEGPSMTSYSTILIDGQERPTEPIYSSEKASALTIGLKTRLRREEIAEPGLHEVRVRTLGPGGGTSAPAFLVVMPRPFYQTAWFRVLFGLGMLLMVVVAFAFVRTRRVARVLRHVVAERSEKLETEQQKTETQEAQLRAQAAQLQAQAARLLELDQARRRFFVDLTHEFRTPLTMVLAPLRDLLEGRRGTLSETAQYELQVAHRNAERMGALIEQLLDLARQEAGHVRLHRRQGDLARFVRDVVQAMAPLAERAGVTLQYRCQGCEGANQEALPAWFDAEQLEKVLRNLLSNALKFTEAGGRVLVEVQGDEETVTLRVRDSGIGIPAEALPHVFDRYYRVRRPAEDEREGMGIGLALTKELVERHGGTIRAHSERGFGSEFTVTLPRYANVNGEATAEERVEVALPRLCTDQAPRHAPALEESAPEEAAPEPDEHAPLVLVVEDNADVRAHLRTHLGDTYRVQEAKNGKEALEQARRERPALVVSDVMMPEMDGQALCRALKNDERLSDVPVLLLSALADEADAVVGLECGADDYVAKPFRMEELKARVAGLIAGRQALRARFSREIVLQPLGAPITSADEAFLDRARAVVAAHLDDGGFTVEQFADEMHLSKSQLGRRLREVAACSPAAFVRELRLQRAAALLEADAGSISEVAAQVGFGDADYFARVFRKTYGMPPSTFKSNAG